MARRHNLEKVRAKINSKITVGNFTEQIHKIIYDGKGRNGMYRGKCLYKRRAVLQNRLINTKNEK